MGMVNTLLAFGMVDMRLVGVAMDILTDLSLTKMIIIKKYMYKPWLSHVHLICQVVPQRYEYKNHVWKTDLLMLFECFCFPGNPRHETNNQEVC